MATLTKSTGTVTLSGAVEKVTFPAVYGWVWVKNMSDSDILAGLSADISEGADGVLTIPAGECGRVQTDGFSSIYLLGTGNALIVAQNYADCPFKVGGKGGEIPDLSAYAKKTDIPAELPANGGNADYATNAGNAEKLGGKSASIYYSDDNFPIKSTDITTGTDEHGSARLWKISEGKTPIFAHCSNNPNYICTPFLGDESLETWYIAVDNAINNHAPITNSNAVTFKVYYI